MKSAVKQKNNSATAVKASKAVYWACLSLLLLAGCAGRGADTSSPQMPQELTQEDNPFARTDPKVLYYVGAAEISGRRDQQQAAAEYYAKAAALSDDPRIVERAIQVAFFAKDEVLTANGIMRWLELEPNALEPNRLAAILQLKQGQLEPTWGHIVTMLERDNSPKVWEAVIKIIAGAEQREVAAMLFRRLTQERTPPADETIVQALSDLALQFGAMGLAEVYATRSIEINPNNATSYLWRGRLRTSLNRLDEAMEDLAKAVELEPDDAQARQTYAALLAEADRFEDAIAQLDAVPATPLVLYSQGAYAHSAQLQEQADGYYQQLIDHNADSDDEKYFLLGQLSETLEKPFEESVGWYDKVRGGDRLNDARLRSAVVLGTHGELARARRILKMMQNGNEQAATRAYLAEAGLLRELEKPEEALDVYSRALSLLPENTDLLFARSLLAEDLERLDMAEGDLRRVLEIRPDDANALNALGYTLADRTDRYEEALALIEQAYKQMPNQAAIVDSMGWVHYKLGDLEQALKYLTEAIELDFDPEIIAHLGEVLWAMGREDDARDMWQKGLKDMPDSEVILETRGRLSGQ
ncbi:MAG: tetratricopeptide repeat protein [Lysobacterales bacterium]